MRGDTQPVGFVSEDDCLRVLRSVAEGCEWSRLFGHAKPEARRVESLIRELHAENKKLRAIVQSVREVVAV